MEKCFMGELLRNEPCGGIGESGAKSIHLLIICGITNDDGESLSARRPEMERRLVLQRFAQVFRGLDDINAARNGVVYLRGGISGPGGMHKECKQQDCAEAGSLQREYVGSFHFLRCSPY